MKTFWQYSGLLTQRGASTREPISFGTQLYRDRLGIGAGALMVEMTEEEARAQCNRLRGMINANDHRRSAVRELRIAARLANGL